MAGKTNLIPTVKEMLSAFSSSMIALEATGGTIRLPSGSLSETFWNTYFSCLPTHVNVIESKPEGHEVAEISCFMAVTHGPLPGSVLDTFEFPEFLPSDDEGKCGDHSATEDSGYCSMHRPMGPLGHTPSVDGKWSMYASCSCKKSSAA